MSLVHKSKVCHPVCLDRSAVNFPCARTYWDFEAPRPRNFVSSLWEVKAQRKVRARELVTMILNRIWSRVGVP